MLSGDIYVSTSRGGRLPRNGGSGKAVRYFGKQARTVGDDGQISRMQLWKGQKRKDQALVWAHASAASTEGSVQAKPNGHLGQRSESNGLRESPEFLPVDPTIMLQDAQNPASDDGQRDDDDSKVPMESLEQWVTRRTREFNRATREQPASEGLWLQYADFQEEAVRAVHGSEWTSCQLLFYRFVPFNSVQRCQFLFEDTGYLHRDFPH